MKSGRTGRRGNADHGCLYLASAAGVWLRGGRSVVADLASAGGTSVVADLATTGLRAERVAGRVGRMSKTA